MELPSSQQIAMFGVFTTVIVAFFTLGQRLGDWKAPKLARFLGITGFLLSLGWGLIVFLCVAPPSLRIPELDSLASLVLQEVSKGTRNKDGEGGTNTHTPAGANTQTPIDSVSNPGVKLVPIGREGGSTGGVSGSGSTGRWAGGSTGCGPAANACNPGDGASGGGDTPRPGGGGETPTPGTRSPVVNARNDRIVKARIIPVVKAREHLPSSGNPNLPTSGNPY